MNKLHNILKAVEFCSMRKLWNGIENGEEEVGYHCQCQMSTNEKVRERPAEKVIDD